MNSSDEHNNELLTAYFDGELSQTEQLQVEQALFNNPELRRQLRDWSTLRGAIQGATSADSMRADAMAASGEKLVMNRIAAAMAAGEVSWATGSGVHSDGGAAQGNSNIVDSNTMPISNGSGAAAMDHRPTSCGNSPGSGSGNWLGDTRHMNPAQRIRRSRWQLGLVGTVAAGLILTVFLNQIPRGDDSAMEATPNRGVGAPRASDPSPSDRMAKAGVPQSLGAESSNRVDGIDHQMLMPLAPGAAAPLASSDVASTEVSPLASEYTNFISFDVGDPEVGLQQMQSVLAFNNMTPIEIFEQDDSPVVVLSGDVKKLAEVLEAFQAFGDNSLSLLAKVGPDSTSFTGPNLGEQSLGDASTDARVENAPRPSENQVANDSTNVAGAVAAPQLPSPTSDSVRNVAMGSEQEVSPPGSVGVPNTGLAQTPMATAGLSQSIPSFNSRQDIIRSQVNVLTNSQAPSAGVTLEDFLNERPTPHRPRVPFRGQNRVESQQLAPVPPAEATASQVLEPGFEAGSQAAATTKNAPSGQQSPGETGIATTGQQSITAGPVDQLPAPIREAAGSRSTEPPRTTETMPSTANVMPANQKPTQIVVILRPKARGQQMPSSNGQQP